ncbi:putative thiamine transporter SLC35F3 [Hypsibius exemplaris]|uniref:Thiamine transporter SLC35F3 n=1 Tax=Hypsibius exemplaris TaxID=2072580 RepID=A0A1W0XFK6_HYPEX|nr:putative thiamine transporter SLC35F3 [Hypsibius exemplaris]
MTISDLNFALGPDAKRRHSSIRIIKPDECEHPKETDVLKRLTDEEAEAFNEYLQYQLAGTAAAGGNGKVGDDLDDPVDEETIQASAAPCGIPVVELPPPQEKSKIGLAVAVLLLGVCSSVLDQQLLKNVFSDSFNAPFFILFTGNIIRLFTLPVYVITVWIVARSRGRPAALGRILRDTSVFKSRDPLPIFVIRSIGIITSFIVLIMSLVFMAVSYATVSEVTAVGTTQVALVYFIAVVFLRHKVLIIKVFAVVVSLSGVGLIAYAKGFHSSSATGIGLVMLSTIMFSFNITYYKVIYNKISFGQCCCFLSATSLYMLAVFWWLPLWTKLSGVEIWEWKTVPWALLLCSVACSWTSSMSMNFGLGLATPLLMSFGSLLRIPLNVVIDIWIRGVEFTQLEMLGSVLIIVGFLIIVIPDNRVSLKIKPLFQNLCCG